MFGKPQLGQFGLLKIPITIPIE
eukprot:SAG11_NODE_825_length_6992_cov_2.298564_1_plen_22_part_10